MSLAFESEYQGETVIVILKGEVDMETAPSLQKHLAEHFRQNRKAVIIDLTGVSYIDSAGIATFVEGLQWSYNTNNIFRLAGLAPDVKDIFDIARLTTVFEIFENRQAARIGIV